MLKVKAGQLDQLGLLFERHKGPLYGYFYRLTSDTDVSEDLVQNVFVRMIKYKHTYLGDGKFSTWMYHMARNLFVDHYKKEKKKGWKEDPEVADKYLVNEVNAESRSIQIEQQALLQKALQNLSADKREVLVMSKLQGMRYQDIADILDLSESAVKVKVFRAMKELKDHFEKVEAQGIA